MAFIDTAEKARAYAILRMAGNFVRAYRRRATPQTWSAQCRSRGAHECQKRAAAMINHRPTPASPHAEDRNAVAPPLIVPGLTHRENEVLSWLSEGKRDAEIATILGASVRTIHKHVQRIFVKLGVETRTAAARTALDYIRSRFERTD